MTFALKSTLCSVYFLPTKYYGGDININIHIFNYQHIYIYIAHMCHSAHIFIRSYVCLIQCHVGQQFFVAICCFKYVLFVFYISAPITI